MLKILSFHPVSLYKNGGASRLLRRLYHGKENQVYSIGVTENSLTILNGIISETIIAALPLHKSWMRWKVRNLFIWLREKVFKFLTIQKIQKASQNKDYDIIHIIHHGPYCMALSNNAMRNDRQLWVSFHDHFATVGSDFKNTLELWNKANRRLVISLELGQLYQELFGRKDFEIITDGIFENEFLCPRQINKDETVIIYFSGLLHIGYYPLFEVFANAIEIIEKQGLSVKLILRGTQELSFLNDRIFITEYRTDFISDEAIKQEMDMASILYLPIKFNNPNFYLYSLSTKMVGYLSSPGTILYHGPADSAACNMLQQAKAAVCCTTLLVDDMAQAIMEVVNNKGKASEFAKKLGHEKFNFSQIKKQFWQE